MRQIFEINKSLIFPGLAVQEGQFHPFIVPLYDALAGWDEQDDRPDFGILCVISTNVPH
jgi:hypothetical protein